MKVRDLRQSRTGKTSDFKFGSVWANALLQPPLSMVSEVGFSGFPGFDRFNLDRKTRFSTPVSRVKTFRQIEPPSNLPKFAGLPMRPVSPWSDFPMPDSAGSEILKYPARFRTIGIYGILARTFLMPFLPDPAGIRSGPLRSPVCILHNFPRSGPSQKAKAHDEAHEAHEGTKSALSRHQVKTLHICLYANSLKELIAYFKRTDRTKFRNQVINPLLKAKYLEMTRPETPTSRLQKYRTTQKGKQLLEND